MIVSVEEYQLEQDYMLVMFLESIIRGDKPLLAPSESFIEANRDLPMEHKFYSQGLNGTYFATAVGKAILAQAKENVIKLN